MVSKNSDLSSKYNLKFALHDPAHCLAPGLFRSIKKGDRKKLKLDITYEFGDKNKIEFSGPEPLGADDLRVLQGLIAMAGINHHDQFVTSETSSEHGKEVRKQMDLKWDATNDDVVVAKGSYRELAKEIGYADCENTKTIRNCVERLWKVSIIYEFNKKRIGCRLLSSYASDNEKGKLFVALNPIITSVIFGFKPQHTRIDMQEVRLLSSDAARLLHQRLCAWINPGTSRNVSLESLIGYVYFEDTDNRYTKRTRKIDIKKALNEFELLKWQIEEYRKEHYKISRPESVIENISKKSPSKS
ncbi:replication protein C, IncQ-type [Silvanigrella aquatica]|uniref:Initiator Rep protein domain-containing protein n=1 Tax=Silvanigrella aquatica TaxID=1915309 RepID=A0A1L4D4V7_9BACT|nr:replication protein C, IncQ-type [Silvanigrella aquatica]APJ05234.1 hypothetical protein AXG55_14525 [Silvanigrella aquatica]